MEYLMSLKGLMDLTGSKDALGSRIAMCLVYSMDLDDEPREVGGMKGFEVDCCHPGLRIP